MRMKQKQKKKKKKKQEEKEKSWPQKGYHRRREPHRSLPPRA
jgi:hypothetical protein